MRRLVPALLLTAACAAPRPCERTLCAAKVEGTVEIRGWGGSARLTPSSPKPPVPSDAEVAVIYGRAEFSRGEARVVAEEGASFRFAAPPKASATLFVSSGAVSVSVASGAPTALPPGTAYALPDPG
jgi:hypothetical protein